MTRILLAALTGLMVAGCKPSEPPKPPPEPVYWLGSMHLEDGDVAKLLFVTQADCDRLQGLVTGDPSSGVTDMDCTGLTLNQHPDWAKLENSFSGADHKTAPAVAISGGVAIGGDVVNSPINAGGK